MSLVQKLKVAAAWKPRGDKQVLVLGAAFVLGILVFGPFFLTGNAGGVGGALWALVVFSVLSLAEGWGNEKRHARNAQI